MPGGGRLGGTGPGLRGGLGDFETLLGLTLCSPAGHLWHVASAAAHCPHLALGCGPSRGDTPITHGLAAWPMGAVLCLALEGQR